MNKIVSYCVIICWSTIVIVLSLTAPFIMSDQNSFFKEFVNHELLNILGVILAITIASAGQLHLELNSIEEKYSTNNRFIKTRAGIKSAVFWLVGLFFIGTILVSIKPLLCADTWAQALFNGAALLILIWNVLVLVSIIQTVFSIKPRQYNYVIKWETVMTADDRD
jgi:hypothetical protein